LRQNKGQQKNLSSLVQSISKLIKASRELSQQAERQYSTEVAAILHTQSRDSRRIEHLLDDMLGFCFDPNMLNLYKKLCRHYWDIDPEATASYVYAYRDMWDEAS
jgi:hypothetical protein